MLKSKPKLKIIIYALIVVILLAGVYLQLRIKWASTIVNHVEKGSVEQLEKQLSSPLKFIFGVNDSSGAPFPLFLLSEFIPMTPLNTACTNDDYEIIKLLLEAGADPNDAGIMGWTPLVTTMYNGPVDIDEKYAIIDLLLMYGADVNIPDDEDNSSVLQLAADSITYQKEDKEKISVKLYKRIEELSDNKYPSNDFGVTPLMVAAQNRNIYLIDYLLKNNKADINETDVDGKTPIMYAISAYEDEKEILEIVKYLISMGADINAKDNEGVTVVDYAKAEHYDAVSEYLVFQKFD